MKLKKIFRKGEIAPQEYITADRRYYIKKCPQGWKVFHLDPDGKYRYYKTIRLLNEARELQ